MNSLSNPGGVVLGAITYKHKWQSTQTTRFLAGNQLYDWVSHRGGCGRQKKIIDIFTHKQQHLSIDMKTKIVQHVPRINISIWHKTCDMRHVTCHMWHNYKYSLLSLHMKTRVVQHVPRINISIWHLTCAMWHVTSDMRNVTCYMWHAKSDMWHMT